MTTSEEPPVVELEEMLDDQTEHPEGRTAGKVALIVALTAVGLAAISILAVLLIPAAGEFVRWITFLIRFANGAGVPES